MLTKSHVPTQPLLFTNVFLPPCLLCAVGLQRAQRTGSVPLVGGMQNLHTLLLSAVQEALGLSVPGGLWLFQPLKRRFHIRRCFSAFTQPYFLGPEKAGALQPKDLSSLSESLLILFPGLQSG